MKFRMLVTAAGAASLLCGSLAHADASTASGELTDVLAAEESRIAAMTDEQAAADARAQAEATDERLDQAIQAGELTPEQAQPVREATAAARDASREKGFRARVMGGLRTLRNKSAHGSLVVLKGAGYAGEAAALGFVAPLWIGTGFAGGAIAGASLPQHGGVRAGIILTSVGAGLVTESTALHYAGGVPGLVSAGFPISATVAVANNFVICAAAKESRYCENIGAINRAMTSGALVSGRRGGSAVHGFFKHLFRR